MITKKKNPRLLSSLSNSQWIKDSAEMRKMWGRADLWFRCEKPRALFLNFLPDI